MIEVGQEGHPFPLVTGLSGETDNSGVCKVGSPLTCTKTGLSESVLTKVAVGCRGKKKGSPTTGGPTGPDRRQRMRQEFKVGDRVRITQDARPKNTRGAEGVVTKVNRKTVDIRLDKAIPAAYFNESDEYRMPVVFVEDYAA